ncbi:hypothetical protein [Alienimonas californiensis]|uniref:Uncharacterized protein n=1 Tax=Alienimonas californiensis TaxID=2527989 RepID=A0A517P983_9PLAN|nr:hypothetical protein [Alienimonas californiensis]QDT15931.1 hypothetical protein CA12_20290 [Alienimonas californiensis]
MVAIVLLAIATGLLLAAAKTAAVSRRALEPNEAAVQAALLVDAGARLAALQADRDAKATEPWSPTLPDGTAAVTFAPAAPDGDAPTVEARIERHGVAARARRVVRVGDAPRSPATNPIPLLAPKPAPRSNDAF